MLEPYLGASAFANHGERVVQGQRLSHAASDIFLSWQRSGGLDGQEHDFYVRQLWDWKASADLSALSEAGLRAYTRACGWSLARAHARSGDRLAIAAYLGGGARFDARWRASPPRTPTRTSCDQRGWPRPSQPGRSRPSSASDASVGEPDAAVEAGRRVEVEHPHRVRRVVAEPVLDARGHEHERPRRGRHLSAPKVKVSSPSRM